VDPTYISNEKHLGNNYLSYDLTEYRYLSTGDVPIPVPVSPTGDYFSYMRVECVNGKLDKFGAKEYEEIFAYINRSDSCVCHRFIYAGGVGRTHEYHQKRLQNLAFRATQPWTRKHII